MRTEDGYIIHKCLNGDPEAFGFLVDKYKSAVYAFAYSKLLNFHDAEDIAQEAFIKAFQKLHTLKRSDSFLAWLYSITSNLCKMWLRSHSKRPDREFIADQEPGIFDHRSVNSYRERLVRELIHEALDSLPEMYREVLSLHYLGGLSCREIARFLGMSPHAIEMRLSRARARLKEEMLIMMSATFDRVKLQPSFTFHIVEIVKRINIHPITRAPWLPWGISLAMGTVLTILSFISYPIIFNPIVDLISSKTAGEVKVLEIGEVPVDVVEVSEVPIISNGDGNFDGRGGSRTAPTLRDALAFLFAPQGGEGKWTKKADMPTARTTLSTSVVNGKIYAIGGLAIFKPWISPFVEEYDPATDKWIRKADMPTARYALSTSLVNKKIYAIGGVGGEGAAQKILPTVEEYDPLTDTWTKKAPLPTARAWLSTSVVNGKIYAIGGATTIGEPDVGIVEEYDPATNTWTKKSDMPTARGSLSTSVVNGKIYAIGGATAPGKFTPAVEKYDPTTDKWIRKADMPTTRLGLSTSAVGWKIYAIGGGDGVNVLSLVEEYDPLTDTWTKKAPLPTARVYLSTSVVNGKIYAIGGRTGFAIPTVEEYDTGFAGEGEEGQGVEAKGKQATSWGKMKK